MSKKPAQFNEINLLPEDPFFSTWFGRTLRWALTAGRYLIIFTELVVIVSFATRFKLDRQKTNLNDSIRQKVMVIESYGDVETKVKHIQDRIAYYQEVSRNHIDTDLFPYLSQLIPNGVTVEQLIITNGNINVSGTVNSQTAFNTLIVNLQQANRLTNISVGKIEKHADEERFDFAFQAQIVADKTTSQVKQGK